MLVDTDVLLRALQPSHSDHAAAINALEALPARGRALHLAPQNLVELWVVMTRPIAANGLGRDILTAHAELGRLESSFMFFRKRRIST